MNSPSTVSERPLTPTNSALDARRIAATPRGVAIGFPIYADRALNAELWDVEGRRYIDFGSGIAVLNTGHRHPTVVQAIQEQLGRFTHTAYQVIPYEGAVRLAERINRLTPGTHAKKTAFFTTGAEAVENAVKIARAATRRPAVIALGGAFHGRTFMGMALTGKVAPYKAGFGPFPAGVYHVPAPVPLHGVTADDSLRALAQLFKADVDPEQVAAIILEPVQGEGGFYAMPPAFMRALREVCDRHGILLIADEIQTGFARTGKMFAMEHAGVAADIVTMAKGLGGGFPIAAVTGRADIMDKIPMGGVGSTFAGNPLSCAASLAVMEIIEDEKLIDRANEVGSRLKAVFEDWQEGNEFACIGEVRALGAMVAIEFVRDRETRQPWPELVKAITHTAAEKGLLLLSCGVHGNVVRVLTPLTIPFDHLDEGIAILKDSLRAALEKVEAGQ